MTMPTTDQLLGSRYRLTDRIAGGGMGEVWRARDEVLGRDVAVKILRREYAEDPTFLERFRAEARHTASLSHPNIAAVYDFGQGDDDLGSPFLVMELVPGEPLSALVAREGPLAPDRTLDIIGQTALGLQVAHDAGVIHRDVKPGNILVTPDGAVRITDFGIARAVGAVPLTRTGAIMGTAFYISPEQASGGQITAASDLYSLGIVAYECLSGRRPFPGDTPVSVALSQVRDEPPALPEAVPAPVRDLVMRLLAKDPAARPPSAGDLGREALALAPSVRVHPLDATRAMPTVEAPGGAAAGWEGPPTPGHGTAVTARVDRTGRRADTDPGFHLPTPSQLPRWLPYAVGVALAVLLLVVVRACGPEDPGGSVGTSTTDDSPTATAASELDVVAADFLGRPAGQVAAELEDLGLRVEMRPSPGGGQVGTVKQVSPTGTVEAGSLVTLGVVAPDRSDEDGQGDESKPGKGKGRQKHGGNGDGEGDD